MHLYHEHNRNCQLFLPGLILFTDLAGPHRRSYVVLCVYAIGVNVATSRLRTDGTPKTLSWGADELTSNAATSNTLNRTCRYGP